MSLRLFIGLSLPPTIAERLIGLQGGVPGARWVSAENLHLTLRFIGAVDEPVAADLDAALSAAPSTEAFEVWLEGVGHFGTARRPNALWAGVRASPALAALKQRIDAAVARAGLPPDDRRFSPHVTVGRLSGSPIERVRRWLEQRGGFLAGPIPVADVSLYRSHPSPSGSTYRVLSRYGLTQPGEG